MSNGNFSDFSFADNPDPRCAVVLVLDASGSMGEVGPSGKSAIEELNEGLKVFENELNTDELAARRVEICVVSVGAEVKALGGFITANAWVAPVLEPSGATPLGEGLELALDLLEERKLMYRANGVSYYRPWILCISDGTPTDEVAKAAKRIKEAEEKKALAFFAVGIDGANMGVLESLGTRSALKMKGMAFKELFVWLSASQARVSASRVGESVALADVSGWASV